MFSQSLRCIGRQRTFERREIGIVILCEVIHQFTHAVVFISSLKSLMACGIFFGPAVGVSQPVISAALFHWASASAVQPADSDNSLIIIRGQENRCAESPVRLSWSTYFQALRASGYMLLHKPVTPA